MLDRVRSVVVGDRTPVAKALPAPQGVPALGQSTPRRLTGKSAQRYLGAYGGSDAIDWVMDCVDLYAQTTSNAEWHVERNGEPLVGTGHFGPLDAKGGTPPSLTKLLNNPNPFQDYTELMELAVIDFLLAGEFIWYKYLTDPLGRPQALYRLAPPLVDVKLGKNGTPESYVFTADGGQPVEIPPNQIVHVKRPNPHDPWRGLSVIAGGPRVYDMELALTEQEARYYEQSTRTSGVLESDRAVPPTTIEKLRLMWASWFGGPDNAGVVPILERGMTYNSISADATEAAFVAMTNLSKERIARMFRVPETLLGETGGSTDRQAAREAQRVFDNKTMRPFLNRFQSQISRSLTQAWDVDFVIDYEYEMPIEDKYNLAQAAATVPGVQVQDLRRLLELPLLQDLEPTLKEIDEMVLNMPGTGADQGAPDNVGGGKGRPAQPGRTKAFPKPGEPTPPDAGVVNPAQLRNRITKASTPEALLAAISDLSARLDDDGEA